MKSFLLIYNPVAGDGYFKYRLDSFVAEMQARQCWIMPVRTGGKDDMPRLVALAKEFPFTGILVAGGDGTVHEVVNSMLTEDLDLPLGIIPSGTSNDLSSFLGLVNDIPQCAELFAAGCAQPVDIGVVNGRYFLNVASAGLLTGVAHTVDQSLKSTLGKAAYYLKGFDNKKLNYDEKVRIEIYRMYVILKMIVDCELKATPVSTPLPVKV